MTDCVVVHQQQTATVVVEVLRTQVVAVQEPVATVVQLPDGAPAVVQQGATALAQGMQPGALVVQPVVQTAVVAVGVQGPPGAVGDAGGAAFMVRNSLSEIAQDPQAQRDAQNNLGLGIADPLAYYILAKS
ncbi:hypothetical protein ACLS0R_16995 [Comamonas jiangduensis]|uniref:hypothetical protein n=1 Tax=Comamonas jiangduensis TaxID=1194168 RepID=UPI003BF8DBA3